MQSTHQSSRIRRVALACLVALAPLTAAGDEPVPISRQGKAGQEVKVGGFAAWDSNCQSRAAPRVSIVQPPDSGKVDVRPGPHVIVNPPRHGTTNCVGRTMDGALVYYVPEPDFRGAAEFVFDVKSPNGQTRYRATVAIE